MSRAIRKVPANWVHPVEMNKYRHREEPVPLLPGEWFEQSMEEWREGGSVADEEPNPDHYMPNWPDAERTHYMMYEECSEGTPISPAFATPQELARWLADNGASSFADRTATYEQWLAMIDRGYSIGSAVMVGGEFISGVEYGA